MKTKLKKQSILNYLVLFREEPEGGYTVLVPSLPGCVSYGETFDEAKKMARDAISLYVEDLIEEGDEIPSDEKFISISLHLPLTSKKRKEYA